MNLTKYKPAIILLNLFLLLGFINWSIASKENTINHGKLVLLELAPVDPRSLMQGDYMRLRYHLSDSLFNQKLEKRGYCKVVCNEQNVATKATFQKEKTAVAKNEVLVKYFSNNWNVNIGADSYFFQEGQSEKYASAKYGGIRVDAAGNSVLVGLYGEDLKLIK